MKEKDLIAAVAARAGTSQAEVRRVLDAFRDLSLEAIRQGSSVPLHGLGVLTPKALEARTIRNVADMRRMRLGRRWTVRMRPSALLRAAARELEPELWRQPDHQAAWRLAETLVSDLDLYHGSRAPRLPPEAGSELVHSACEGAFGPLWTRVQDSYTNRTPDEVRASHDYLADAARQRWAS